MPTNSGASIAALVDALHIDPFYIAITEDFVGDEDAKRRALSQYFDYSMSEGARIGRCVLMPEAAHGAAVWLLPATPSKQAEESAAKAKFLANILGPKGVANYHRIIEFMSPRAAAVVSDATWYLSIIGVAPSAQGKGVGAQLLAPTLGEADHAGVACYLETFTPRNLRFYERLGFEMLASHVEPVTAAEYVIMCRAARRLR